MINNASQRSHVQRNEYGSKLQRQTHY